MRAHLHLASNPEDAGISAGADSSIKVVLADDHAAVRRSLRSLLEREADLEVIAEAADLSAVARHVYGLAPRVLVLDLEMPGGSSVETIRSLCASAPDTEIVVLHMDDGPAFAHYAIDAGAIGFVLKHLADMELPTAVRSAARGEEYISPQVGPRLAGLRRAMGGDGLSARATEVLRLVDPRGAGSLRARTPSHR